MSKYVPVLTSYDKLVRGATKPKATLPKQKYIDPLISATHQREYSLQDVLRALKLRMSDSNSIVRTTAHQVVLKSLIVLHMILQSDSCTAVLSYVARDPSALRLRNVAMNGLQESSYTRTMSRYANYLDYRILGFRELGYDPIATVSSRGVRLRHLPVEKGLLRETSVVQKVTRAVLECAFFAEDRQDDLTLGALHMVLKDLLVLFMIVNEGVINILGHYFEMSKPDAERALELYKRFVWQTERVVAYLKATRKVSYGLKMSVPRLQHAPVSLASSLEEYLKDPNFEKNRAEYIRKKGRGTPERETEPAKRTEESKKSEEPGKTHTELEKNGTDAKTRVPAGVSGNKALEDFFEALEGGQSNAFNSAYSFGGLQTGNMFMAPQTTGFVMPQATGMPFVTPQHAVPSTPFQSAFTPLMPQATGNPFTPMQPQMTGNPFGPPPMQMPMQTGIQMPMSTGMQMPMPTGMPLGSSTPFDSIFGAQPPMGVPQMPQQNSSSSEYASKVVDDFLKSSPKPAEAPAEQRETRPPAADATLRPQKTGFQNPFSIPSDFEPPPAPPAPKGPTLHELAKDAWSKSADAPAEAPQPQEPMLSAQRTGMASVSSEFVRPRQEHAQTAPQSGTSAPSTEPLFPQATKLPDLGSLSLAGNSAPGQTAPAVPPQPTTPAPLNTQPTGLSGLRSFKPESQFGNSLASNPVFSSPVHIGNPFGQPQASPVVGLGIGDTGNGPSRSGSLLPGTDTLAPSRTGSLLPGADPIAQSRSGSLLPGADPLVLSGTSTLLPGADPLASSRAGSFLPSQSLAPSRSGSLLPGADALPQSRSMSLAPQATGTNAFAPRSGLSTTSAQQTGALFPQTTDTLSQPQAIPQSNPQLPTINSQNTGFIGAQSTGLAGLKSFQPTSAFGNSLKNQPATQDLLQL